MRSRLRLPAVLLAAWFTAAQALAAFVGPSGHQFILRMWDSGDGLPHNSLLSLAQTRDGFLWAVARGAVVRFDGITFRPVTGSLLRQAGTLSVDSIFVAPDDRVLFAGNRMGVLQWQHGITTQHPISAALGSTRVIRSLLQQSDGTVWALATSGELLRWQHGRLTSFPAVARVASTNSPAATLPRLAQDHSGAIFVARAGGLETIAGEKLVRCPDIPTGRVLVASSATGGVWFAANAQLGRLDTDGRAKVIAPAPWPASTAPTALVEGADEVLWIGTTDGRVYRWTERETALVHSFTGAIHDLLEDAEGNVWVATEGAGLARLQPARFALIDTGIGSMSDMTGGVCEDAVGDIWFVSRTGIRRIRPSGTVEELPAPPWPAQGLSVAPDQAGNVWLGSGSRLYRFQAGSTEVPQLVPDPGVPGNIHSLYCARDGGLWVGRENGTVERFGSGPRLILQRSDGMPPSAVLAIGEDANGRIWLGMQNGRLFSFDHGKLVREPFATTSPRPEIRAIHCDHAGVLWIGTSGDGLGARRGDKFVMLTTEHGLSNDVISQVLEDDFGALWFGSPQGLFKVNRADLLDCADGKRRTVTPIHFGRADGLPGVSMVGSYQPTGWKTRSGVFWFVSRKGLVVTDPAQHQAKRPAPLAFIESVRAGEQPLEPRENRVPTAPVTREHKIEFRFTAPSFVAPEQVRFRYRLIGFDTTWNEPTTQRFASYSGLAPGRYTFEVTAGNHDAVWSDVPASFAIEVLPQWWETWWARTLALTVAAGMLTAAGRQWALRRWRTRVERLERRQQLDSERARIARDLHDDLGTSLTHAGMVAEEIAEDCSELTDARTRSGQLAARLRTLARDLDAIVWSVAPKNDSLPALCAYVGHFAVEFFRATPIRCRVRTSPDIPATSLSPEVRHHIFMIARELMNNALKHSGADTVTCDMHVADGAFVLRIEDDGRGLPSSETISADRNGLTNLRFRATELGGTLSFDAAAPRGTAATLRIPLAVGEPPVSTVSS